MTETTLAYSLGRHTCTSTGSKVTHNHARSTCARSLCKYIDLAYPPRRFACAEIAPNARLRSFPVQPRGAARRTACKLHCGIAMPASCIRRARCPAQKLSLTTQKVAALRGVSRPTAWCGAARSPPNTTSRTAPVERVSSGEDAIKRALRGLFSTGTYGWGVSLHRVFRLGWYTRWSLFLPFVSTSPALQVQ